MADIKISELTQAESLSTSDLLESAVPYNGGFLSRRMSLAQLSNYLENYVQHQALTTTAKTIVSAINEILGDLANYYTTSQTYSKTQVDQLIAGVSGLHFEVVSQLPTTDIDMNTIYLVPKQDVGTQDIYDEYICLDDTTTPATWEKIGTTEIDLSDYVTDTELSTILNDYVTSSGLNTILADYATTSAMTTALADKVDKVSGKGLSTEDYTTAEKAKLNGIASGAEVNVQSNWTQSDNTQDDFIKNKPNLATVATSGSYNDLTDKPTIPTNTDEKVKQTAISSSSNANYRLLLSKSASNTEETDGVYKDSGLYFNPYDDELTVENVDIINTAKIATAKVTNLITSQYYFSLGSGSAVAMLEANSASTTSNPTFVTLPASSGTLALQSDITSAINDLDVASTSIAAGETLATIKEDDGKIAVTKQNIKINQGQVDNTCIVGTQSAISGSVTWHKFASTTITGTNTDCIIMLAVNDTYIPDTASGSDTNGGILYCRVRQGNPVGTFSYAKLKLVANSGLDARSFRLYYTINSNGITFELWTSLTRQYAYRRFTIINQGQRTVAYANNAFTLSNSTSPSSAPTESASCVRVECEDNTYKQTDNETLGATNLIPYPYINGHGSYYVRNNVTISVNENGVISASGTAPSSGFGYGLSTKAKPIILDPTKSYIMSGLNGGSSSTVRFLLDLWTASQNPVTDAYTTRLYEADGETTIPSGYKYLQITLYFYTGAASMFPLTVSPMLRLASIADSTFKTYSDTNRNLSMNKADLRLIADTEKTSTASRAYAVNELMFYDGNLYRVKTAITSGGTITTSGSSANVVSTTLSAEIKAIRDALNI